MGENGNKSLDLLGIKPISNSVNTLSKAAVDGASSFLSRVCLPASEEFGLLLRDKISNWRLNNHIKMIHKAQKKYKKFSPPNSHAHPRLVSSILNHSSWIENERVQEMWAGLLASSCTESGNDESNLIFINILSQITSLQAKVINHACEKAEKRINKNGLVGASRLLMKIHDLKQITDISDCHRLDRELDHLRSLGIIVGGISTESDNVDLTPSDLGIQLYVRCQGVSKSPIDYFGLTKPEDEKS